MANKYTVKMRDMFDQLLGELKDHMATPTGKVLGQFPIVVRIHTRRLKNGRPFNEYQNGYGQLMEKAISRLINLVSDVYAAFYVEETIILIIKPATETSVWLKGKVDTIASAASSIVTSTLVKGQADIDVMDVICEAAVYNIPMDYLYKYLAFEQMQLYNDYLTRVINASYNPKEVNNKSFEEKGELWDKKYGDCLTWQDVIDRGFWLKLYVDTGDEMKTKVTKVEETPDFIQYVFDPEYQRKIEAYGGFHGASFKR